MSRPNHYKTLKVSASATHAEIRRAYHAEARRWHPDRFSERSVVDAKRADDSMRDVNEAWRVLRDDSLRQRHDHELAERESGGSAVRRSEGIRVGPDNITRIDPRLLDPEFINARRKAASDHIDNRSSAVLRMAPWLGLASLLIGIFVFTAYQGDDRPATTTSTLPGPDVGVPANACVRIIGGPQLLEIPCTGVYDGRVIGAHEVGGACPELDRTIRTVELSNEITVCLGP